MPAGFQELSTFSPDQQKLFSQLMQALSGQNFNIAQNPLYQSGASYLQQLLSGSPESTAAFEAPYLRQFNEQTIPGLAERFSGANAQSSSAFQNALGQAGAGLSENLAGLRSGLQMQALPQAFGAAALPSQQLQQLLGIGTKAYAPKQQPFWQQLLLSSMKGGAQIGGSVLGNPGLFM